MKNKGKKEEERGETESERRDLKRFTSLLTPLPSGPIISSHSSKTPHSPFIKFQICNIYKLKKKKKKKLGYCLLSQLHHLPWLVTTLPVFLLGVCNATPWRQHRYTSFSLAALSFVCSTLLLYLLITAQHCCEAVHFDRLVSF